LAISHHLTKITISNTPTITKNDSSAAAVAQSSALLPPRINANTPSGRDPAISRSPPGDSCRGGGLINKPLLASGPPPKLQAPPHSSHRSISIVSSRVEEEKVSNFFIWLCISIETHLLDY
jgi:hypothetical protein